MTIIAENARVVQVPGTTESFYVNYCEIPLCVDCNCELRKYDKRQRIMKIHGGKTNHVLIQRFECNNSKCQCGVITVLPSDLTPNKWYATMVIEDVLDEVCTPDTPPTENYPCEKTMNRWKKQLEDNKPQIEGMFRTAGSRLEEFGNELLETKESILDGLRERIKEGWLPIINRYSCLFKMALPLQEAVPPDLSLVREETHLSLNQEDKKRYEKSGNTELAGRRSTQKISFDQPAAGTVTRFSPKDCEETADSS